MLPMAGTRCCQAWLQDCVLSRAGVVFFVSCFVWFVLVPGCLVEVVSPVCPEGDVSEQWSLKDE